jgi:hypothetical protein
VQGDVDAHFCARSHQRAVNQTRRVALAREAQTVVERGGGNVAEQREDCERVVYADVASAIELAR